MAFLRQHDIVIINNSIKYNLHKEKLLEIPYFKKMFDDFYKEMILSFKERAIFINIYYEKKIEIWDYLFEHYIYLCNMKIFYIYMIKIDVNKFPNDKYKDYIKYLLDNNHNYSELGCIEYFYLTYKSLLKIMGLTDKTIEIERIGPKGNIGKPIAQGPDFTGYTYFENDALPY